MSVAWRHGSAWLTFAISAAILLGPIYGSVAVGLNVWFVWSAVRVLRERSDEAAQAMFRVSLVYLFGILAAMLVDLAWKSSFGA